jgi:DNA repair protein RecN (Recombination protein N)
MLKKLKINNFAIIENIDLEFQPQLTVITGETGSGKSILLGALNLLLGERADYSVIRDNTRKTIIEGHWQVQQDLKTFFEENDLDFDEHECIVRREILKEGKSRAFINDTPVNLNVLRNLTKQLIYIHSQHNTLELRDKNFQLNLLDVLGNHEDVLRSYRDTFLKFRAASQELNTRKEELARLIKERDYIDFQIEELSKLNLDRINYSDLQERLQQLENGELILENASQAVRFLDHSEGILPQLSRLKNILVRLSSLSKYIQPLTERVISIEIDLRDIQTELEQFAESITLNPNELHLLNEQLNDYNRALKKHQAESQSDLANILSNYLATSETTSELENTIEELQNHVDNLSAQLNLEASKLTESRKKAAEIVVKKLQPYFERLKLRDAQIEFVISPKLNYDLSGCDTVDILFSTNSGIAPQSIEKVASGGELSRLMLILMTLLSERKALPTVIFDEIDTGVSGDVADRIGQLLREMGENRQLLTITHLPQVAAAGHHHLSVRKIKTENQTVSEVMVLGYEERVFEIAKLLSGEDVSSAALENSKILLSQYD